MKFKNLLTQSALAVLLTAASAFAQTGSSVGGGNITEADLQYYMNKLDAYLISEEGQKAFPEIVAYDQAHPQNTFHQVIQRTRPVVQKGELHDSFGQIRDCLSFIDQGYFVCNSDALPDKTLENQPSFYRIVFHELLVQAGIEKPVNQNIPSEYPISSRITENVHLETYREWVPGKETYLKRFLSCSAIVNGRTYSLSFETSNLTEYSFQAGYLVGEKEYRLDKKTGKWEKNSTAQYHYEETKILLERVADKTGYFKFKAVLPSRGSENSNFFMFLQKLLMGKAVFELTPTSAILYKSNKAYPLECIAY